MKISEGHQITEAEYRRIGGILRARALRAGIPEEDLEDFVQDIFLRAQRALDSGAFEGRSALDTWIVGIGRNQLMHASRMKKALKRTALKKVELDPGEGKGAHANLPASLPDPGRSASDRQILRQVVQSIDGMPEKHRSPLVLAALGLEYGDIAEKLGLTVGLVTSRLFEARAKLRRKHARSPDGSIL